MERKKTMLHECPQCGGNLKVRELHCPSCHIRIQGNFEPQKSRLLYLTRKELDFVELFIRVRGNIKEVEKALGVSYPTVRGLLESIIKNMGYTVQRDNKKRMEILDLLDSGEISVAKATELLQGSEEKPPANMPPAKRIPINAAGKEILAELEKPESGEHIEEQPSEQQAAEEPASGELDAEKIQPNETEEDNGQ